MLGVLLALLGGMLGLAGGGGGSSAPAPATTPGIITKPDDGAGTEDPVIPPDTGGTTDDDDTGVPVTDPDSGGGTITPPDTGTGRDTGTDTGTDTGAGGGTVTPPDTGTGTDTGGHGGGHGGGGTITPPDTGTGTDTGGHGDGHGGGGTITPDTGDDTDDDGGHGGHGGHDSVDLPTTPEEIAAFVRAVRNGEEVNVHDHGDALHTEHMQAMSLVSPAEATHIAIGNGSWFDPSNWHNGEVPGDDSMVVIPDGVHLDYDQESDARLFTVRVDGTLEFANDADSKMVVDTMVVAPGGTLTAGTEAAPIADDVSVEIVIANNGPIDTDWDPALLSRGLISHGKTEIHGQIKDSHEKVVEDPMAGDTSVRFTDIPEGWEVGDTIVIAGTQYDAFKTNNKTGETTHVGSEDEVRTISMIDGDTVHFEEPLVHDHDTPRADLKTSVANYSRSVTIRSEDGDESEVYERGHVMMMHSDDVDIRYAAFQELGRTDKSEEIVNTGDKDNFAFDDNVKGRYGLHLHRTGTDNEEDPAILTGNAVFGSPGWGIVHHDSNAMMHNNATFDTFGAGYVAESGNETGVWSENIAIYAEGRGWQNLKGGTELDGFDTARTGDGFWFQGRMVASHDNVAASVNHGFAYFHRGGDGNSKYDATQFEFADALNYADDANAATTPITAFSGNETFASRQGLQVVKASPKQGHDIHSVLEDFTAWNVDTGAHFQYTSHYVLKDFDVIGNGDDSLGQLEGGITFGKNVYGFTIVDAKIDSFHSGIELQKGFSKNMGDTDPSMHNYVIINADISNVKQEFDKFDISLDTVIDTRVTEKVPTLELDGPLVYTQGSNLEINGTKTDSIGSEPYPSGPDNFDLKLEDVSNILREDGYYLADDGHRYFTHNMYMSDRLTGDIYKQLITVRIADNVPINVPGKHFHDANFKGEVALSDLQDAASKPAQLVHEAGTFTQSGMIETVEMSSDDLWDALTTGQGAHSDHQVMEEAEDEHMHHTRAAELELQ